MIARVSFFLGLDMQLFSHVLGQLDPTKLINDGTPPLTYEGSNSMTWIIVALLTVGIVLITFKTSKRNHLERD